MTPEPRTTPTSPNGFPVELPSAEESLVKATALLDLVAICAYYPRVPSRSSVVDALEDRLVHDCNDVHSIREELHKLAPQYNRFIDLRKQLLAKEERVRRIVALLGHANVEEITSHDHADSVTSETAELAVDQLRNEFSLWQFVREYLLAAREAKVGEIQDFLGSSGIEGVSRQAIESVVKRHPKLFRMRRSGRERFVTLKTATD